MEIDGWIDDGKGLIAWRGERVVRQRGKVVAADAVTNFVAALSCTTYGMLFVRTCFTGYVEIEDLGLVY